MSTDICISFDTTGSMSPCIAEVRRRVGETIDRLFDSIPDLRISIVAHGDYCDGPGFYSATPFTDARETLKHFVRTVHNTNGGDYPECYEYVLEQVSRMDWQAENRALVLIADAIPHELGYWHSGYRATDWTVQARALAEMKISIYAVEALGESNSKRFYEPLAMMTNGRKVSLNQFTDAVETLIAISYHATGDPDALETYKQELEGDFKLNRNLANLFTKLGVSAEVSGGDYSGLVPVPPYRFQILHVDNTIDIKSFVIKNGAHFAKGRGFYQFTKPEEVQEYKEVVLRNRYTGDMFTGEDARNFIGLPFGSRGHVRPDRFSEYEIFIQSTSVNRKLMPGTKFLYENP